MTTRREMLVIPAPAVQVLREGLCGEMAGACEGLLAALLKPEHVRQLAWCQPHLQRFDAARSYLEAISRGAQADSVSFEIGPNGLVLIAALRGALAHPVREQDNQSSGVDDCLRDLLATVESTLVAIDAQPPTRSSELGLAQSRVWPRITPREEEVLGFLTQGLPYRVVASQMRVTVETVRSHARRLRQKFGVRSSRELANAAVRAYISSK